MYGASALSSASITMMLTAAPSSAEEIAFALGGILSSLPTECGVGDLCDGVEAAISFLTRTALDWAGDPWARRNAIESLGLAGSRLAFMDDAIAVPARESMQKQLLERITDALVRLMGDEAGGDPSRWPRGVSATSQGGHRLAPGHLVQQRRFMSAISLAQVGAAAVKAVPALLGVLHELRSERWAPQAEKEVTLQGPGPEVARPYLLAACVEALRRVGRSDLNALRELTAILSEDRSCPYITSPSAFPY